MNRFVLSTRSLAVALAFVVATVASGQSTKTPSPAKASTGVLVPITEKDAAWATKAKAEYPTEMCIISDDKLGDDHGTPVDMIYREAGKSDRLIAFCCKDCVKEFNEDPQKGLKALDDAAAKKKAPHTEHKQ